MTGRHRHDPCSLHPTLPEAIAHLQEHVTFWALGTPDAGVNLDPYCSAYPQPKPDSYSFRLIEHDHAHLIAALAAVLSESALREK